MNVRPIDKSVDYGSVKPNDLLIFAGLKFSSMNRI